MSIKSNLVRGAAVAVAALTVLAASATSAAAADRRVVVVNSTEHTLVRLYASNTNDPNYHNDLLGSYVMRPGASTTMDFDDGTGSCWFDVKGVFSDGDKVERHNFNVCTETEMRFTGN
jgi:hypothetical protein